jgi:multiple sugar transport system permease protein
MKENRAIQKSGRRRTLRKTGTGVLFFLPNLLGFLVFFAVPLVWSFYLGFTDWDGFASPEFIGFQNFANFLFKNPLASGDSPYYFWKSLKNTLYYCVGSIPPSIVLAFGLAILLNSKLKGMNFFRTIYFLPVVSAVVAVALLWRWLFAVEFGPINYVLGKIGGPSWRLGWLTSPKWAMPGMIIMAIWRSLGYNIVIFLAGLQGIPTALYEAAIVDGASNWRLIRHVTIPLMTPSVFFVLVMSTISGLQVFSEAYMMTAGGPARATLTVVYNLYQQGFSFLHMGMSSAMGWMLFLFIFVLTLVQTRLSGRWVHYE